MMGSQESKEEPKLTSTGEIFYKKGRISHGKEEQ
jgi:hypothetical protein